MYDVNRLITTQKNQTHSDDYFCGHDKRRTLVNGWLSHDDTHGCLIASQYKPPLIQMARRDLMHASIHPMLTA